MTPDSAQRLPALRPVEVVPFRTGEGEVYFALQDPLDLARGSLALSAAAGLVLMYLDGQHTRATARAKFRAQTGMELPEPEIDKLLLALDEALLLANARSAEALRYREAAYAAAECRTSRDRYPDPEDLHQLLEAIVREAPPAGASGLRGLVAPHLDYPRGRPAYAAAYATLAAQPPADRYIVLGTNHSGTTCSAVATGKDFETPLGRVVTDREFLAGVERRLGVSLCDHAVDHQREHSIELQVHFLQVLAGHRPFTIVPMLCPDVCGPSRTRPADGCGPELRAVASALREAMDSHGDRTVVIAGADLSHVGQRFQDADPSTPEFLDAVGRSDLEFLRRLSGEGWSEAFDLVAERENPTRICSTGALFTLRAVLGDGRFELLRYHQSRDFEAETHVSCCAAVVW